MSGFTLGKCLVGTGPDGIMAILSTVFGMSGARPTGFGRAGRKGPFP